eukprot:6730389-Alexandrium_andersonii.AAC.1
MALHHCGLEQFCALPLRVLFHPHRPSPTSASGTRQRCLFQGGEGGGGRQRARRGGARNCSRPLEIS